MTLGLGASASMQEVLCQLPTLAAADATVLIRGETGTGKEGIARTLHTLSARRNGPFVKLNCAAVPAGLLESELMGHERGAFTGAVARRIGRFEAAQNGSLFLDEIGELEPALQPKLLRLLQEREFERVGSCKTLRSNARFIAATNRNLEAMLECREFRHDLYYRLSVIVLTVPPLRERRSDIPELVAAIGANVARRLGRSYIEAPAPVLRQLLRYDWPGNVRELENVTERAVILGSSGWSSALESLRRMPQSPPPCAGELAPTGARSDGLNSVTRAHILRVLQQTNWVVAGPNGAAARLEMKRSTLNFRMKKLGIERPRASSQE